MDILKKQKKPNERFLIMIINGGLGKNILATAVISAMKKQYFDYKIIVVSAWTTPYHHNPDIEKFLNFNEISYFYDNYVFEDTKILKLEVYDTEDHILQRKHLVKSWLDLYGIEYNNEQPKLYLNPREIELVKDRVGYGRGKPLFVIHSHGGASDPNSTTGNKSWSRDIPILVLKSIVDHFKSHYRILHIRHQTQPALNDVETIDLPQRELFALIAISKRRLFIDSFSQHAAAALGLKSTVCWIGNKPEVFGYDIHDNILAKGNIVNDFGKYKFLDNNALDGQPHEYPYDDLNIFDVAEISNSIKTQG